MTTRTKSIPKTRKPLTPPAQKAPVTRKATKPVVADTFAQSSLIPQLFLGRLTTKSEAKANIYALSSDRERVLIIPLNAVGAPGVLCFTIEVSELRPEDRIKLGLALAAKTTKQNINAKSVQRQ